MITDENFKLYYTLAILILLTLFMLLNYNPIGVLTLANLAFYFGGVLILDDLTVGFSNSGLIALIIFSILIRPLIKSLQVNEWIHRLLHLGSTNPICILVKVVVPVFFLSFVINNTPLVYLYLGFLEKWCLNSGQSATIYLIPLSFASILGGVNTLIGTSTNFLAGGLVNEYGYSWSLFHPFFLSFVPSLLSLVVIVFGYNFLLPERENKNGRACETIYKTVITIPNNSILVDMNILYLTSSYLLLVKRFEIEVGYVVVENDYRIKGGDKFLVYATPYELVNFLQEHGHYLDFVGAPLFNPDNLKEYLMKIRKTKHLDLNIGEGGRFFKIIVNSCSPVYNTEVQSLCFEKEYPGIIVALTNTETQRMSNDEHVYETTKIDNKVGLLVYSTEEFYCENCNNENFVMVTRYRGGNIKSNLYDQVVKCWLLKHNLLTNCCQVRIWHIGLILFSILIVLALLGFPLLVLIVSMLVAGLILGVFELTSILDNIDWPLYLTLALSIPPGIAVTKANIGEQVLKCFTYLEDYPIVIIIVLGMLTLLLTNCVNNATAVSVMIPLAYEVSQGLSFLNTELVLLWVTCLSSCAFLTPYGYQTNLIVYRRANYVIKDFLKVGTVATIVYFIGLLGMYVLLDHYYDNTRIPTLTPSTNIPISLK